MNTHILDKVALFLLSLILCIYSLKLTPAVIVCILITISLFCLSYYYENANFTLVLCIIQFILSIIYLPFIFFTSPILYDLHNTKYRNWGLFSLLPLLYQYNNITLQSLFLIVLLLILSLFFSIRAQRLIELEERYIHIRDDSEERKLILEKKNEELMEVQDYEIHMATLKERNRIAREIHDNVGHLLSRSILQVGACLVTATKESDKLLLTDLKETLNTAMTSIRESIHDIHDESIDLDFELQGLVSHFNFCPINYEYTFTTDLDRKSKYSVLAIVKESLANIMKHSNASQVSIVLREHPGLFQILISDNGTSLSNLDDSGLGLKSMKDRVESLKGTLRITSHNGFRIFISLPKIERKNTL